MISPIIKGGKSIILSKGQMLKEAEKKIAVMEDERKKGMEHIKQMTWQIAQLRMAVTALCMEYGVSTEKCKEIYDAFCAKEDARIIEEQQKAVDAAKKKLQDDIKAGKKVEFTAMDRNQANG